MDDSKRPKDPSQSDEDGDLFDNSFDKRFEEGKNSEESDEDLFILDDQFAEGKKQPEEPEPDQRKTLEQDPAKDKGSDPFIDSSSEMEEIGIDGDDLIEDSSHSAPAPGEPSGEPTAFSTEKDSDFLNMPEEPRDTTPEKESLSEESPVEINLDEESDSGKEEEYLDLDLSSEDSGDAQNYDDLEELFEEESREIDLNRKDNFEVLSNSKELEEKEIKDKLEIARKKAREQETDKAAPQVISTQDEMDSPSPEEKPVESPSDPLEIPDFSPAEAPASEGEMADASGPAEEIELEDLGDTPVGSAMESDISSDDHTPPGPPPPESARPPADRPTFQVPADSRKKTISVAVVLVVILAAAAYFFLVKKPAEDTPVQQNQVAVRQKSLPAAAGSPQKSPEQESNTVTQESPPAGTTEKEPPAQEPAKQSSQEELRSPRTSVPETPVQTGDRSEQQNPDERRAEILQNLKNMKSPEEQLFEEAREENSIEKYREYVSRYPRGEFYGEAISAINRLNKTDQSTSVKQKISSKTRSLRRITLPANPSRYTDEELEELRRSPAPSSSDFEQLSIRNQKILVDYGTGLIWHLWTNPMDLYKVSMFKARKYAEYTNWRLPTTPEARSFPRNGISYFLGQTPSGVTVWTADASGSGQVVVELTRDQISLSSGSRAHYLLVCKSIR